MDRASQDEMVAKLTARIDPYIRRFATNIFRAKGLVSASESDNLPPETRADVLRSAVVFMHATLEQFLRQLASSFLPLADENVLNDIPLVGGTGRPEKFLLGKLRPHREKTVELLIQQSVDEHLKRSNFNDIREVNRLLTAIGIETEEVRPYFSALESMMSRRHQIVHRADNLEGASDVGESAPIERVEVDEWISALHNLSIHILPQAVLRHFVADRHITIEEGTSSTKPREGTANRSASPATYAEYVRGHRRTKRPRRE